MLERIVMKLFEIETKELKLMWNWYSLFFVAYIDSKFSLVFEGIM